MAVGQPRVLIADDSNAVHQLIGDALPVDYATDVTHAYNGIECLNALDDGVDLAFIDVHMPTMGGMDALWAARIAGNKTFVTLMSGAANRRCIDLARQLDAYEFLTKPFGRPEIDAILTTHRRITTSDAGAPGGRLEGVSESHAQGAGQLRISSEHRGGVHWC